MVDRRQALKISALKLAAVFSSSRAANSQNLVESEGFKPELHSYRTVSALKNSTNLKPGDVANLPEGLYRIVSSNTAPNALSYPSTLNFDTLKLSSKYEGRPPVIPVEASDVVAILDTISTRLTVSELENDKRTYQDILGEDVDVPCRTPIVTEDGFRYEITQESDYDFDLKTAGGVRLKALPDRFGRISARQFGVTGTHDDRIKLKRLFSTLKHGRASHILIDIDVNLPGSKDGIFLKSDDVPNPCVLEFLPNCRMLFSSDGSTPHNYLRLEGISNIDIINPQIINTSMPKIRHALAGIFLKNCDNCRITNAYVEYVCGAGIVMENSRRCIIKDSTVVGSLADGFHITNGLTGPSEECWTYNCIARETGDDGVSIVSYRKGGVAPCLSCGHINFYVSQSAARGASIVGGNSCRLQGEVWRSSGPGLIIFRDDAYDTYDSYQSDVMVMVQECGVKVGAAGIQIGAGCDGITGTLVSLASLNRGISIASLQDPIRNIDCYLNSQRSGGDGIYIENVDGLNLRSAYVNECAHNGLVLRKSKNVTVSQTNIRGYGTKNKANRGLLIHESRLFFINSGILIESLGQSEKAIRVSDSRNGNIMSQQMHHSVGEDMVEITESCNDVLYDGAVLRLIETNHTLECQNFGARTNTQLTGNSVETVYIPEYSSRALPLGAPARIINTTDRPVKIVTRNRAKLEGIRIINQGAAVVVIQVRPDFWHIS